MPAAPANAVDKMGVLTAKAACNSVVTVRIGEGEGAIAEGEALIHQQPSNTRARLKIQPRPPWLSRMYDRSTTIVLWGHSKVKNSLVDKGYHKPETFAPQ